MNDIVKVFFKSIEHTRSCQGCTNAFQMWVNLTKYHMKEDEKENKKEYH